jgi:hypothetical protein
MRKKLRIQKFAIKLRSEREQKPILIAADAAIATTVLGQGKLIPLVILETSERPDPSVSTMVRQQLPNSLMYGGGEERSHVDVVEFNESFRSLGLKHSSVSSGGGE